MINLLRKRNFGFTLIEMIVVLGIISIIVGLITVSLSTAQKKARDTKRKTDLTNFQNCMEEYFSTNTSAPYTYPSIISTSGTLTASCDSAGHSLSIKDPLSSGTFVYTKGLVASGYLVSGPLEIGGTFSIINVQ